MAELDPDRPGELVIDTELKPAGEILLTLSGELDLSTVGALEATIASITAKDPERLIFDLSGLRFMDSAGIAVLVDTARKLPVQLRDPSPIIRRVVELTGLSDVLPIQS
ncbi:MAG TPA: STAS domain-containing protein [Solirubrobacteraceae bacterium]|jgi:anti-sigma B factor antagonist